MLRREVLRKTHGKQIRRVISVAILIHESQVPLDYADPSGPQAGIALVKVAATAQESRGPVLINPGTYCTRGTLCIVSLTSSPVL